MYFIPKMFKSIESNLKIQILLRPQCNKYMMECKIHVSQMRTSSHSQRRPGIHELSYWTALTDPLVIK